MLPSDCSICYQDTSHSYWLEGHTVSNVNHFFHPDCIRQWLDSSPNCPTCRQGLEIRQIVNPHYSRLKNTTHLLKTAISLLNTKKLTLLSLGVTPIVVKVALTNFPKALSGTCNGAGIILMGGIIPMMPIICNKVMRRNVIDIDQKVNKLFAISIVTTIVCACCSPTEESSVAMGKMAAAIFSMVAVFILEAGYREEHPRFIQVGPFPVTAMDSNYVVGSITGASALLVGTIAVGQLALSYTKEQGTLIKTISMVAGSVVGAITTGILASLSAKWWLRD